MKIDATHEKKIVFRLTKEQLDNGEHFTLADIEEFCRTARAHLFDGESLPTVLTDRNNNFTGFLLSETTDAVPAEPLNANMKTIGIEHANAAVSGDILPPKPMPGGQPSILQFQLPTGEYISFQRVPQAGPDNEYMGVGKRRKGDWNFVLNTLRRMTGNEDAYLETLSTMKEFPA